MSYRDLPKRWAEVSCTQLLVGVDGVGAHAIRNYPAHRPPFLQPTNATTQQPNNPVTPQPPHYPSPINFSSVRFTATNDRAPCTV